MTYQFLVLGNLLWVLYAPCQAQQSSKTTRTTPVTARTIEQSITKIGGKATLQKYFCGSDDTSPRDDLDQLNKVATGAREWVDLAVKMLNYSDAGCSEDLHTYLGSAMQQQPLNVLPYVGKSPSLAPELICLPFISAEIPDAEALRIVRRTKTALLSVRDRLLTKQCQLCMTQVTRLEKTILTTMTQKTKK